MLVIHRVFGTVTFCSALLACGGGASAPAVTAASEPSSANTSVQSTPKSQAPKNDATPPASATRTNALSDATIASVAKRFGTELECANAAPMSPTFMNRHWCPVAKVEASGPLKTPSKRRTLLGLSMELRKTDGLLKSAHETTDVAILTIDSAGALVTTLKPSNDKEKESLGRLAMSLALVVKGKGATLDVPADVTEYLKSFDTRSLYPVSPLAAGAEYTGTLPSRIYSLTGTPSGESYVVVEGASGGVIVNLFPIVPSS